MRYKCVCGSRISTLKNLTANRDEVTEIGETLVVTVTLQEVTIKSNRITTLRERIYHKGESGFTEKQRTFGGNLRDYGEGHIRHYR